MGHYLLHKLLLTSSPFTKSDTSTISSVIVSASEVKFVIIEAAPATSTLSSFSNKILPKEIFLELPGSKIYDS